MTSDGQRDAAPIAGADAYSGDPTPTPQLRALVLCDLALDVLAGVADESHGVELVREHDQRVRALLVAHGGFEADKTDGFLALFERPIQAVGFALAYQRELREMGRERSLSLAGRVGVHVGDVVTWRNSEADVSQGARQVEVEGLAKPVASRLMHLARPGQILLSGIAVALAQRAESELECTRESVQWLGHGPYRFKGVPAPMEVHEVGEIGLAPLRPPSSDAKAVRERPWWRRPLMVAAEVVVVIAVLLALFMLSGRPQQAIAFIERDWVVVGDLRNISGNDSLSEALDIAFRISLEQSRHVNVLSNIKVRDTLRRMQRDEGTPIDRDVGSEVALREGARALILPTVADIGGRLRVSAEIIDPNSQATIYAVSDDASSSATLLHSVDRVTSELRASLGEAMRSIQADSEPLPEVTTEDLAALRAFALGETAIAEGRFDAAIRHFSAAVEGDPRFALAHLGLARVHMGGDDLAEARRHLDRALAERHRLAPREAVAMDVLDATYRSLDETLGRLRVAADLYPDRHWVHSNYALFAWERGNRHAEAIEAAERALVPQNPGLAALHYLLGTLHAGQEDLARAETHFRQSVALGRSGLRAYWIGALAAARDFEAAHAMLDGGPLSGHPSNDLMLRTRAISMAVDRGRIDEALQLADGAQTAAARVGSEFERLFHVMELSIALRADSDPEHRGARIAAAIAAEASSLEQKGNPGRDAAAFRVLLLGWLALHSGEPEHASEALAISAAALERRTHPVTEQLAALLRAEQLRMAAMPDQALELLMPLDDDSTLLLAQVVQREILADLGQHDAALELANRLAARRGRAYAEVGSMHVQQPLNLLEINLAVLRAAELAIELGDHGLADLHLSRFLAHWPDAAKARVAGARVQALQRALGGPDASD